MEDNSHAGQGAVLLDIGGDVGALVVLMPARTPDRVEIEARPAGHSHGHSHGHGHEHSTSCMWAWWPGRRRTARSSGRRSSGS